MLSKEYFDSLFKDGQSEKTVFFDTLPSTNTYLKELLKKSDVPNGFTVVADSQTHGKGRLGRSFSSPENVGLYLSFAFDVRTMSPEEVSRLTAWSAVSVRRAILSYCSIDCKIKWVNDLVFKTKKVSGILTESVFDTSGKIKYAVIGIGINVNNALSDFPEELREKATSLKMISGKTFKREELLACILKELNSLLKAFPKEKEAFLSEYKKNCAILDKRVIFGTPEKPGTAVSIDNDFSLIVLTDSGEKVKITYGDVGVKGFYGV